MERLFESKVKNVAFVFTNQLVLEDVMSIKILPDGENLIKKSKS